MNRTELEGFFKRVQESGDPCKLTYYCLAGKCTFYVNTFDANGKSIQKRHPVSGAQMFSGNKPIYAEQKEEFFPIVPTRSAKADALCFKTIESTQHGVFTAYQKEMIAVLEEMAENESSQVKRESEYKRSKNPEAWQREQEIEKLKKDHVQKIESAKEEGRKEAETEIDRLKKMLGEAEKQISQLTEPINKPNKQGMPNK